MHSNKDHQVANLIQQLNFEGKPLSNELDANQIENQFTELNQAMGQKQSDTVMENLVDLNFQTKQKQEVVLDAFDFKFETQQPGFSFEF